jgi:hypothetical protein
MVDYAPFLARAVATLNPNTSEQRQALYDRARRALVDKLRTSNPTLSDVDLRAESAALESSIRHVEADEVRRTARPQSKPERDAPIEKHSGNPLLTGRRQPLRIAAFAFGALVMLAGVAAYSFWPRIVTTARGILGLRVVGKAVEQPAATTGYIYLRQPVYYRSNYPVGTIVVDKGQGFLYVVRPSVSALRFGIGVGSECVTLNGLYKVLHKEEWPGWKEPPQRSSESGDDRMKNPFGARALYLDKNYRIHGTNASLAIRQHMPDGCIGLVNDDVIYLYDRTPLESRVVVLN